MAIGGAKHFGIFVVAGSKAVIVDNLILRLAAGHNVVIVFLELGESLLDGLAVASPIAFVIDIHIAHIINLVVAKHHVAAGLGDRSEVVHVGQLRHLAFFGAGVWNSAFGQSACSDKGRGRELLIGDSNRAIHIGQVEVAPVDGNQIPSLAQNLLVFASALDVLTLSVADDGSNGCLAVVIDCQFGRCAEVELHIVLLLVVGTNLVGDEVDGSGHQLNIIHQEGRSKDEVEVNSAASECIVGTCRQDVKGGLGGQSLASCIGIEADISQSATSRIVDVIGNDVLTFVQNGLVGIGEPIDDILHPGVTRSCHSATVDVGLTDVVVRIDES